VLRVRAAAGAIGTPLPREMLVRAAAQAGAELRDMTPPDARFAVADDVGAARLLQSLIAAGVPVMEAMPEESRLERLFMAPETAALPGAGS
jgi:hypothetical protein